MFPVEEQRGRFPKHVALAGTLWAAALAVSFAAALLWLVALGSVARGDLPDVAATILATSCLLTAVGVALTWALARRMFEAAAATARNSDPLVAPAGLGSQRPVSPSMSWSTFGKDPLTGLFSQPALLAFADDAIPYFRRYRRGVSILMVEVDDFATIAQTFRLDGTDPVLRHVAEVLDFSVRKTDKVARFEEHRFVILLREINQADTLALANRIRDAVSDLSVRLGSRCMSVTVSIGAAIVAEMDASSEALIARAEMALEASKTGGGNRVTFKTALDPNIRDAATALSKDAACHFAGVAP